jgi:hypothetical protein
LGLVLLFVVHLVQRTLKVLVVLVLSIELEVEVVGVLRVCLPLILIMLILLVQIRPSFYSPSKFLVKIVEASSSSPSEIKPLRLSASLRRLRVLTLAASVSITAASLASGAEDTVGASGAAAAAGA